MDDVELACIGLGDQGKNILFEGIRFIPDQHDYGNWPKLKILPFSARQQNISMRFAIQAMSRVVRFILARCEPYYQPDRLHLTALPLFMTKSNPTCSYVRFLAAQIFCHVLFWLSGSTSFCR